MTGPRPALVSVADSRMASAIAAAWGAAEASFFFVVPDVWLGYVALVAPRRTSSSVLAALAGAVGGVLVLLASGRVAGPATDALIARLPGIRRMDPAEIRGAVLARAERAFLNGPLRALPVKLYVREAQRTGLPTGRIVAAATANRLVRFVPVTAGFALLGRMAQRTVETRPRLATALYAGGWTTFYALYWRARREPEGPSLAAGGRVEVVPR